MLCLLDGARAHPEWVTLSHERACLKPLESFRGVAENLGLGWCAEAERYVRDTDRPGDGYTTSRVAADLPDQWRQRLSDDDVERIEAVLDLFPRELWEIQHR
jgi:hypothetical protein